MVKRRYEGNMISLNQLQASKRHAKLSDVNVGSSEAQRVQREVKRYSLDDHFKKGWDSSRELFDKLSAEILNLDTRIEMKPVKQYIGFQISGSNVVAVKVRKSKIILELVRVQPKDVKDPEKRGKYHKNSYQFYHVHISQMLITSEEDISYAVMLAKQTLQKFDQ